MEQVEPGCVEFLDLSGIEDQERNWILSSLYSWNPNIQLPWVEDLNQQPQQAYDSIQITNVKLQKCISENYVSQNLVNETTNQHQSVYSQIPPSYILPQQGQQILPVYSTESASNLQTTFVVNNSNINYNIGNENSNTYINTKQLDGFTNGFENNSHLVNHIVLPENITNNATAAQKNQDVRIEIEQNGEAEDIIYPSSNEQNDFNESDCSNVSQPVVQEGITPPAKSWASLFNKSKSAEPIRNVRKNNNNNTKSPVALIPPFVANSNDPKQVSLDVTLLLKEPFKSNADDPNLHRMGEYLSSHVVDNRIISLQPRGLINRSNYCYINSILQAMLACPPVYNLLCGLSENMSPSTEKKKITPTIDSIVKFIKEFHHLPAGMRVGRRLDKNQKKEHNVLINCDTPFEPFWIHKLLSGIRSDTFVVEGRQEDAEEFLGCLLNGLNDEMLELIKLVGGHQVGNNESFQQKNLNQDEDKEWQVMGPKNKGAITRRTELNQTPISDIFGGLIRSRLHRAGDQSTDNIQPFFTLQLNIEKANTVKEALEVLVCKSQLEGVTSSKTNEEVEAWQQVTLEELPIVLVLHLKCFDYKVDGCSKIIKALEFPIDLKIDMKLLSSKTNYTAKERMYKLFSVVYHEGKEATKGHYVTDAYHVGYASWLRYDDASVKTVPEEHVLKPHGTRVPYLLFYRRSDALIKHK